MALEGLETGVARSGDGNDDITSGNKDCDRCEGSQKPSVISRGGV